ncbi:MAG: M48 family metallopeptidase [Myxococcota bacterium]
MASVGQLDFRAFVDGRSFGFASAPEGPRETHAYAYISDRNTRSAFRHGRAVEYAVKHAVRLLRTVGKGELLGSTVKVGPRQLPRVYDITRQCAETLGIETPTVHIRNSPVLNAMTSGTQDDAFIIVHSSLIDALSDDELLSVIGHECGHIHNDHVVYLTTLQMLRIMASRFIPAPLLQPAMFALSAWSRRAEITCDRAGLLCSRDLAVSEGALAKLALGSDKLWDDFDIDVFLEQYDELKEELGKLAEVGASHPWIPKRIKALRAFNDSELYREHIGLEGGTSMDQVDEAVHGIIKVAG